MLNSKVNPIIQSIVVTVVGATVLAGLIALARLIRGLWLKWKITKALEKTTIGSGVLGVSITIRNNSQVEWRVREVFLCTPSAWYKFNPVGEESDTEASYAELYGNTSPRAPMPTPHLAPLTGYTYRLPPDFMRLYQNPATGLSITVDYKTYSGRWKSLKVQTREWANDLIQRTMEHHKREFDSGSLSRARARFHREKHARNWNVPKRAAEG